MPRRRLFSRMLLVPQAIQTPQLSTGLPALVDPENECIRSATEGSAGAVRSAESGLRNANCERLEGIKVVSKGEEKGRAKPPGMAMGHRYRYGYGYRDGCPYRHYSGLVGTGLGEFGGASRFGTDLRRRLLQPSTSEKRCSQGIAGTATLRPVQQLPRASQKQQAPFVYGCVFLSE